MYEDANARVTKMLRDEVKRLLVDTIRVSDAISADVDLDLDERLDAHDDATTARMMLTCLIHKDGKTFARMVGLNADQ